MGALGDSGSGAGVITRPRSGTVLIGWVSLYWTYASASSWAQSLAEDGSGVEQVISMICVSTGTLTEACRRTWPVGIPSRLLAAEATTSDETNSFSVAIFGGAGGGTPGDTTERTNTSAAAWYIFVCDHENAAALAATTRVTAAIQASLARTSPPMPNLRP